MSLCESQRHGLRYLWVSKLTWQSMAQASEVNHTSSTALIPCAFQALCCVMLWWKKILSLMSQSQWMSVYIIIGQTNTYYTRVFIKLIKTVLYPVYYASIDTVLVSENTKTTVQLKKKLNASMLHIVMYENTEFSSLNFCDLFVL